MTASSKSDADITPLPKPLPGLTMGIQRRFSGPSQDSPRPDNAPPPAPVVVATPSASLAPLSVTKPSPKPAQAAVAPVHAPVPPPVSAPPLPALTVPPPLDVPAIPLARTPAVRPPSRLFPVVATLLVLSIGGGLGVLLLPTGPASHPEPRTGSPPAPLPERPQTSLSVTPIVQPVPPVEPPSVVPAVQPPSPVANLAPPTKPPAPVHSPPRTPPAPATHSRPLPAAAKPAPVVAAHAPAAPKPLAPPLLPSAPPPPSPVASSPPPPDLTGSKPVVAGSVPQITPAIIRAQMSGVESKLPGCVREGYGGNISIGVVVDASGSVQKVNLLGPLAQTPTGKCIADRVRQARFPAFTEGGPSKLFVWSYQLPADPSSKN